MNDSACSNRFWNAADTEEFLFADSFCSEHSSTASPAPETRRARPFPAASVALNVGLYEEKIKYEEGGRGVTGVIRVQVSRNCRVSRDGK